jgi:hypothetical protein
MLLLGLPEFFLTNTAPQMKQRLFERLAGLDPEERFARAVSFMTFSRQMIIAGILSRAPNLDTLELRHAVAEATLPPALVQKLSRGIREIKLLQTVRH